MNFLKTMNILERETVMKKQYLSEMIAKIIMVLNNLLGLVVQQQNRQVSATVSWNR